jgi:Mg2+-importing ATPase
MFIKAESKAIGLTDSEVMARKAKFGWNEVGGKEVKWWHILLRQFQSPFLYLLLGAAVLAFFLGENIDGGMIILFVTINTVLGFYQEHRSEKTLHLLKKYLVHRIRVRRGGEERIIESRELVPDDVVILQPGDIIPADLKFLQEEDLMIDESILTGESAPVKKFAENIAKSKEECVGLSGTTVVSGRAIGLVYATGKNTRMGKITKLTVETKRTSGFEKRILTFSKFILRLILLTLVLVFVANLGIKKGNVNILELLIFSVALAISVIPEALPVVTTFSLSGGALRLAKNKVVVKRLSAIEEMGSVDVLCTDKTGTLTENKMKVAEIFCVHKKSTAKDLIG